MRLLEGDLSLPTKLCFWRILSPCVAKQVGLCPQALTLVLQSHLLHVLWWPRTQASGDLEVWKEYQTAKGFTQSHL